MNQIRSAARVLFVPGFASLLAVMEATWGAESHPKEAHAKEAHPRRAEVMERDRSLAHEMNKDYGHLSGHYDQLQHQDANIRKQTKKDMQQNGGHLTKAQQK